jgi:hypothetical protein
MTKYIKHLHRKFAAWLRFNPVGALSGEGWNLFNAEFKSKAPIRYWFHRDFNRNFILPIKWRIDEISEWIRYRTYDKYHVVKTGLPPGYADKDTIMLHTNFNLLKDYVEVEIAMREWWSDDEPKSWAVNYVPLYRRFMNFRRPDLGLKQLEWAATLDDPALPIHEQSPHQAVHARETIKLYKWWVSERPSREEVVIRNLRNVIDRDDLFPDFSSHPEYPDYINDIRRSNDQEDDWHNEDEEMLIRLIKIRRGLWS